MVQFSNPYMATGKNHNFNYTDLCQQSNVLAFNIVSRFVIAFSSKEQASLKSRRFDPWTGRIPGREGIATHSSLLARRIPRPEEWRAAVHGVARSRTRLK